MSAANSASVMRMSARDVGGVAAELGAGVDEQRVQLRRLVAPLDLVVQHCAAFIQRDDRVVRQLALALATGRHERERNLEFAGASAERAFGGNVTACTEHIRLAQAGDLIGSLRRSPVVELRDEMFRIDRGRSPAEQLGKGRADEGGAREILGQCRARRVAICAAHDVEARRPVAARHFGRLVPVVHGLMNQQQRLLARGEKHERIRRIGERRPHLEWRLDAKWQVVIVEEQQRRGAGMHQQGVVPRGSERRSAAFLHDLEVFGEQAGPRSRCFVEWRANSWPRFYARANTRNVLMRRNKSAFPVSVPSCDGVRARRYVLMTRSRMSPSADKNCSCFKWIGESIKSRAAMQIAATNVCLVSLTTRYFWGTPT